MKLNTIQKRENLNEIFHLDEEGPGGAHHEYIVCKAGTAIVDEENPYNIKVDADDKLMDPNAIDADNGNIIANIRMQRGPRNDEKSMHGLIDSDLLEIVRDRLTSFQNGPYATEYNARALEHVELALMYLNRRVEDRISRNVLGTYNK